VVKNIYSTVSAREFRILSNSRPKVRSICLCLQACCVKRQGSVSDLSGHFTDSMRALGEVSNKINAVCSACPAVPTSLSLGTENCHSFQQGQYFVMTAACCLRGGPPVL
jgi:hypothetical protein